MVEELQGSLDTWRGTLNTSGGDLDCDDPNKNYWYNIDYELNVKGRWKYCAYDEDLWLMLYDDVGRRKEVPHCHTDVAHKTLRVILASDDNKKSQVKRMRQIFSKFGDIVRVGYIQGDDVL